MADFSIVLKTSANASVGLVGADLFGTEVTKTIGCQDTESAQQLSCEIFVAQITALKYSYFSDCILTS